MILFEGKSKIVRRGVCDDSLVLFYTDIVTAFNGGKRAEPLGKGRLCAAVSNLLFAYLEQNGIKTHTIKIIDETSVLVKKADIIKIEVIVRNVAAGGFSKKYGVAEGKVFDAPIVEFCLKSDELNDPMINESQIIALNLASKEELLELERQSLYINTLLCKRFEQAGIRLIDFKLEFGKVGGEIILCDEISPDSCRLWDIETGAKMDKDIFRQDLGDMLLAYEEVLRRLEHWTN